MNNEIIKLILSAEIEGLGKVTKQLNSLAKGFSLNFSQAIQSIAKMDDAFRKALGGGAGKAKKEVERSLWEASVKGVSGGIEMGTNLLVGAMQDAKGSLTKTIQGAFKGAGGGLKEMGKSWDKLGKRMAQQKGASWMGKKGLGVALRGLGGIVRVLGVVATSIASLISLLIDVEAQAKDFNKTLLEGGVAGGDLATNLGDVYPVLENLRGAAVDFRNNLQWGTVAKEQLEIIGAFNEAGYTIREMTKNVKDAAQSMKDYQDVTRVALTYSKLLGLSAREVATQQTEYMESLGASLSFVEQQFNAIYKTAQLSGFGVKRFYSMIQQATSGMAMYNVRLDEAAGLLLRLGKILGSRVAGDFLQQLNKGFVDESMQDRFKRVMTTGSGKMKEIFENSAEDIAFAFGQKFKKTTPAIKDALTAAGVTVDFDMLTDKKAGEETRKLLVQQLAKMDKGDQAKMLAKIRAENEDMARELSKLAKVSEGTTGSLGDMAKAMGGLDMGGTLAAKLASANAIIGKPLHEMSAIQLTAFENITGISGEQREILMEVSKGLTGQFDVLQEQSELAKKAIEAGQKPNISEDEMVKQLEAYGAYVDEQGNIMTASLKEDQDGKKYIVDGTKKAVNDMGEYIQSQGDVIAQVAEQGLDENTALAQEIARNTTDMAKVMEIGVQYWLEQIYKLIAPWVAENLKTVDPKKVQEKTDETLKEIEALNKREMELNQEMAKMQRDTATLTGPDKKKAEEALLKKQDQLMQVQAKRELQRTKLSDIGSAWTEEEFQKISLGGTSKTLGAVEKIYGKEGKEDLYIQMDLAIQELNKVLQAQGGEGISDKERDMMFQESLKRVAQRLGSDEELSLEEITKQATDMTLLAGDVERLAASVKPDEYGNALGTFINVGRDFNDLIGRGKGTEYAAASARKWSGRSEEMGAAIKAQKEYGPKAAEGREKLLELARQYAPEGEFGMMGPEQWAQVQEDLGITGSQLATLVDLYSKSYRSAEDMDVFSKKKLANISDALPDKTQRKQEGVDLAKTIAKENQRLSVEYQLKQLFGALPGGGPEVTEEMVNAVLEKGSTAALKEYGISLPAGSPLGGPAIQDFLWRPGRDPMQFSERDTIVGAKPGGPIDKMLSASEGGGGAGGPAKNVNINIYGSQGEVYATVKRVLKEVGVT